MADINRYTLDCYATLGLVRPGERGAHHQTTDPEDVAATLYNIRASYKALIAEYHPEMPRKIDAIRSGEIDVEALGEDALLTALEQSLEIKSTPDQTTQPKRRSKDEQDHFEKIHLAYETLSDYRRRYKYDYRDSGYFDIEWQECFIITKKRVHKPNDIKRRECQRKQAINKASFFDKCGAFASSFFYGTAVFLTGVALMGIASAAIVLSLLAIWLKPNLVPEQLTKPLGVNNASLTSIRVKLLVTCFTIVAAPFLGLAMFVSSIYAAGANGHYAYRELTARGMNKRQKVALAMCLVALTTALLIAFPPAGLVAALGTGSVVASAIGMANFTLGGFLVGASALAATVTGAITGAFGALMHHLQKPRGSRYTYPSLKELEARNLYQSVAKNDREITSVQQHLSDKTGVPVATLCATKPKAIMSAPKAGQKSSAVSSFGNFHNMLGLKTELDSDSDTELDSDEISIRRGRSILSSRG